MRVDFSDEFLVVHEAFGLKLLAQDEVHVDHEPEKPVWSQEEVEAIAKTVYGEAMVTGSDEEMSAVVWCILNRVDSPIYPDSIIGVITQHS